MKILIDEDLPYSAAAVLAELGHEVWHAHDAGLIGQPDKAVIAKAQELEAALLTADLDFANIHIYPPGTHGGIIVLRFPDFYRRNDILAMIRRFAANVDIGSLRGALVVVSPGAYRVRR